MTAKISICIPTFNRSILLAEALASVESNLEDRKDVEVVISDNASQDETEAVVDSFKDRIPNLRYYKNTENIGPVNNLRKVIESATGNYIWILSDDDVIVDGALSNMIGFLTKNPGIMYVFYSRELVDCNLKPTRHGKQPHGLLSDLTFSNGNELFCSCDGQMPYLIGFFSSTIIQRNLWLENAARVKVISDNYAWDHLIIILKAIKNQRCAILSMPGVKARLNFRPLKANSKISFDDSILSLIDIGKMGYSDHLINKVIARIIGTESKSFVVDQAKGLRKDNIVRFLAYNKIKKYMVYSLPWGAVSLLPVFLLKTLWDLYSAMIIKK